MLDPEHILRIDKNSLPQEKKEKIESVKFFLLGFYKYFAESGESNINNPLTREYFLGRINIEIYLKSYLTKTATELLQAQSATDVVLSEDVKEKYYNDFIEKSEEAIKGIKEIEIEGERFEIHEGDVLDLFMQYILHKNKNETDGLAQKGSQYRFRRLNLPSQKANAPENNEKLKEANRVVEESRNVIAVLKGKLESSDEELRKLKESLSLAEKELSKKNQEIVNILGNQKKVLAELEGIESRELSDIREKFSINLEEIKKLQNRMADLNNEIKNNQENFQKMKGENARLLELIEDLQKKNAELLNNLRDHLAKTLRSDLNKTLEVKAFLEKIQSLSGALEKESIAFQEKEREIFGLNESINRYTNIHENDLQEIKRLETLIRELNESLASREGEKVNLEKEIAELSGVISGFQKEKEEEEKRSLNFRANYALKEVAKKTFGPIDRGLSTFAPKIEKVTRNISRLEAERLRKQANEDFEKAHAEADRLRQEKEDHRLRLEAERQKQKILLEEKSIEDERKRLKEVAEAELFAKMDSFGDLFSYLSTQEKYKKDNLYIKIINKVSIFRESGEIEGLDIIKEISQAMYDAILRIYSSNKNAFPGNNANDDNENIKIFSETASDNAGLETLVSNSENFELSEQQSKVVEEHLLNAYIYLADAFDSRSLNKKQIIEMMDENLNSGAVFFTPITMFGKIFVSVKEVSQAIVERILEE